MRPPFILQIQREALERVEKCCTRCVQFHFYNRYPGSKYPGRSKIINFLTSFSLMSTFKYVCAVFLRINDLNVENRKVMGWILVVLDVVFMLASVVAFVLVIQ